MPYKLTIDLLVSIFFFMITANANDHGGKKSKSLPQTLTHIDMNSHFNTLLGTILFIASLLPTVRIGGSTFINNQVSQPAVDNRVSSPSRAQELPIPADGDCLYKSIMMAYLLPVSKDADLFNARLAMLVGENTIIQKEKTKNDKDDNKDDIKIDINQVWDVAKIRQNVLYLRRSNLVYSLRQYPFPALVSYMRTHMGIEKKIWGGKEEIQKIADKLQITIEEYTPNPDDHNNTLTEPIRIQPKQKKVLLTLRIVRDNPTKEEAVDSSKDWQTQLIQEQSIQDAQQRQHYRALLTPIPDFLLAGNNPNIPGLIEATNKNNPLKELPPPTHDSLIKQGSIPSRQQEIPIRADGNCLYNSLVMDYLLPVAEDGDIFNARLAMLVGEDKIMPTSATKSDKGDENKDDNKDDNKAAEDNLWDAHDVNKHFRQLRRTNFVARLRLYPFPQLVTDFRQHMGMGNRLWGGPQAIKTIANKLQLTIKEYTPNPDDHNKSLTEPLCVQCKQGKPLLTLRIVRDNPTQEEAVDKSQDWKTQLIQKQSIQDAQQRQHYRALLTPIPAFLLGKSKLGFPIPKNNPPKKAPQIVPFKPIKNKPNLFTNKAPKQHSIAAKKHLAACRGRQLWQGLVTCLKQGKALQRYLIVTDDDLLLLFEKQPAADKAPDVTNAITVDLAKYHTIQAEEKQIIITTPAKEQAPAVMLLPTKQQYNTLLHILRYATQRYYTLEKNTLEENTQNEKGKNVNQKEVIKESGDSSKADEKDLYTLVPLPRPYQAPPKLPEKWSLESLKKAMKDRRFRAIGTLSYMDKSKQQSSQKVRIYITKAAVIHLFKRNVDDMQGGDHLLKHHIFALPLHPACYKPVDREDVGNYYSTYYSFILHLTPTQAEHLGTPTLEVYDNQQSFVGLLLYHLHYPTDQKTLISQNYQAIQCTVSCQGFNDPPFTFYCCVNKLKYNTLAYQALGKKFQHYFGTPLLQLTRSKEKNNLLHSTHPIDWTNVANHHFILQLAKPVPKPLETREFTKPTDEQLCAFLREQKRCTFYDDLKNGKKATQEMLNHLHDYHHPKKTACLQGKDCPHLSRVRQAKNQQTLAGLKDRVHFLAYLHPRRDRTHELRTGDAGVFAYEANFAKMNPIKLPAQHPYHRLNTPYHPRQGLSQLLTEAAKNQYPLTTQRVCETLRYFTLWEYSLEYVMSFKLIAKVTYMLCHRKHKTLGQPLNLPQICAVVLYTDFDKLCSDFRSSQMQGDFAKWTYLDRYLMEAILLLDQKEKKHEETLYSGLCQIRFDVKEKYGFLATYTSTSEIKEIANKFSAGEGMLMHITPEMRKYFPHCDVSWLSRFPEEKEHLFARSADTGLFTAYQWKGTVTRNRSTIQEVRFTPSLFPPLVVASGKKEVLTAGKLHRYSYIKLGRNATITTASYNPDTQQGGRLSVRQ